MWKSESETTGADLAPQRVCSTGVRHACASGSYRVHVQRSQCQTLINSLCESSNSAERSII